MLQALGLAVRSAAARIALPGSVGASEPGAMVVGWARRSGRYRTANTPRTEQFLEVLPIRTHPSFWGGRG